MSLTEPPIAAKYRELETNTRSPGVKLEDTNWLPCRKEYLLERRFTIKTLDVFELTGLRRQLVGRHGRREQPSVIDTSSCRLELTSKQ